MTDTPQSQAPKSALEMTPEEWAKAVSELRYAGIPAFAKRQNEHVIAKLSKKYGAPK